MNHKNFEGFMMNVSNAPYSGDSELLPAFVLLLCAFQVPVKGAGTVQYANGRTIDENAYDAFHVLAADLDGDGDHEVLVSSFFGDWVRWYDNEDGKGTFSEAADVSTATNGAM